MGLYSYKKRDTNYSLELVSELSEYRTYNLSFDSPVKNGVAESDTVRAVVYLHNNPTGKPPIIFIHGIGMNSVRFKVYSMLAEELVRNGFDLAIMILPYHYTRTPMGEGSGSRMLGFNDVDTFDFFYKSIVETRTLIDIMDDIGKGDRSYYVLGVSLGAMISSLLMGVEKRVSRGIFLVGGSNWEEIHWGGVMRFFLNGRCSDEGTSRKICHKYYSKFPEFLEEFKKDEELGIKSAVKKCFLCDPLIYAHKINPDRVLMINALFDGYFSRKSVLGLWNELGKPKIHWLMAKHSGVMFRREKIIKLMLDFLDSYLLRDVSQSS